MQTLCYFVLHMNMSTPAKFYCYIHNYKGVSKSFETSSIDRQPMAVRECALCEHWELHKTSVCHHVCLHTCDFSMDMKLEQRTNIKFCVKLSKSGADTFEMILRAYRNEAMSCARCFDWHACFKRGRTSLEDDERSGRTSMR
jgi:hypothetical protein